MKILIIEDDENILSFLKRGFEEDGYIIDTATNGEDGEYLATVNTYDLIILDWMLPMKDGMEILSTLRNQKISTPTIMLTAKSEIDDKVSALNIGADDYLSKPFSFKELNARVQALYRRSLSQSDNTIHIKNLIIDINTKVVSKDNEPLVLTQKEYELLLFLIKHKNTPVSNIMIEDQLWNYDDYINSNVIQVTIYNLRKKIGKEFISSSRGLGYKVEV
ncbi:MAG: response regulator transcription factor [Campylobacteraceae bacterium]|jgi:DNA-binding response OmpR family regulator|nr:response regulator transcription factor [Campylobacteraceae bacterium]MBT3881900.1 response regulator transcription factor [Campylobacteraceae bacterium]MBT4030766.1 response regulator transcription factor [Campylobacteraceae bacterium]MBT4178745.1 response regulator transcription factor [Campylobacteraceae bacterium]MBT4572108.1 response regulator transcription factor [Campylobacteraceae bacterium]